MKRFWIFVAFAWLIPAEALAQGAPPAPPTLPQGTQAAPLSRLWIVAGGASGTLRGHCQDCEQDFPFRHGGALVGNAGYRVNSRMDVGADLFWMQWHNESGRIRQRRTPSKACNTSGSHCPTSKQRPGTTGPPS